MTTITAPSQLDLNRQYSYADYLTWEFGEWFEIIGGQCSVFSPPGKTPAHQQVVGRIGMQVTQKWPDPAYETWSLPLPLILGYEEPEDSFNLVLPDLYVIRKESPNYLDERGWHGVPDWIVEVTDARTQEIDRLAKHRLYQYFGIKEYWIVSPEKRQIDQFVLNPNGIYQPITKQDRAGQLRVQTLPAPGLEMDRNEIFS
ncbi:Uma2 family endonuclease [Larkinella sp. C7]|uniref:Uma2 family endonuclease n=1 Tax=Larkinella sp. C7 TaxID=2576607 RepID=UPI0011111BCC|nr:Uma2 family endonuclease [Larkinella sp. C7]